MAKKQHQPRPAVTRAPYVPGTGLSHHAEIYGFHSGASLAHPRGPSSNVPRAAKVPPAAPAPPQHNPHNSNAGAHHLMTMDAGHSLGVHAAVHAHHARLRNALGM